ncbi:MAG: hypothetical protein ISR65_01090 [Bacteriovoracaceae bacterium]|nr:hypothetical protein [Bacteriovoracaceae bacterium]
MTNKLLLIVIVSLISCAELYTDRSHYDAMTHDDEPIFQAGRDFPIMVGDSGRVGRTKEEIQSRTPASKKVQKNWINEDSIKQELLEKERRLTEVEFKEYNKHNTYFASTSEKIYYLDLPPPRKKLYLKKKVEEYNSMVNREKERRRTVMSLLRGHTNQRKGLYVGMDKQAVIRSWGKPYRIEVAGNPKNQNERWIFNKGNSRIDYVYFESGIVQGWEIE